jgi:cytochrome c
MFRAMGNGAAGLVLALLVIVGVQVYGNVLVPVGSDQQIAKVEGLAAAGAAPAEELSLGALLSEASADEGKKIAKKCVSCHTFEPGGPTKVGPNLANTVGHDKGSKPGFAYSAGMQEKPGNWTYEDLNTFLTKPSAFVSGTKMTFAGLAKAKDRAAVITYLASITENPPPKPKP